MRKNWNLKSLVWLAIPLAVALNARTAAANIYTDWSGTFSVSITTGVSPTTANHNTAMCTVPADYVLIGGGGGVDGEGGEPGVLSTFSGPSLGGSAWSQCFSAQGRPLYCNNASWQSWIVATKDAFFASPHKSRCYAIGLKVKNVSADTLRSYLTFSNYLSNYTYYGYDWEMYTNANSATPIIGGGGGVNDYYGDGKYLVALEADNNSWKVSTKDHITSSAGQIVLNLVQFDISRFAADTGITAQVVTFTDSRVPFTSTSTGYIRQRTPWDTTSIYRSAVTALGGRANYTGAGRLITQLGFYSSDNSFTSGEGTTLGVRFYTKDHKVQDSGYNTLSCLGIRKYTADPIIW